MFNISIFCPDAFVYKGPASFFRIRTSTGDIGISGKHSNYLGIINYGELCIRIEEEDRFAACTEGFISIIDEEVTVVLTTLEWAEDIDLERTIEAYNTTKAKLEKGGISDTEYIRLNKKLKRAENRRNVAQRYAK
ncbi:F0F1 ATP synthase subunit epsilon [Anaeropeptidivorans aminofermentans]|jgi:ATP synthase F1 epsilon subunit|uniref:F0F1 ATP synthase subunit epsilon n=1 Tax=Anaeropeptidivorans aminofermentans TaxID=2934315 RepID=UPI000EEF57E6|nr:ATP synthase delta/epsilon chain alpha-helix domain-containing protein [Anaeropeptidivorans aminofermentans]MBE6012885.1 hypothetical protein [Lachnospiraceae bacterium]HAQ39847.1 hypothetical protein [Clostridiales bacterium]